jgi:tRNA modification GTPase
MNSDTIVALASAQGIGAISVLRISGASAFDCVRSILPTEVASEQIEPRKLYLRQLQDDLLLDHALLAFFPAPQSYTGENLAEIFCHGGEVVASRIIAALLRHGCRLAEPGEFTRRAVENGKMDLLQAEAINDLVMAESPAAADNALRQLDGELSEKIKTLRAQLIKIAALLELELDFAEEDVRFADRGEIDQRLREIARIIEALLQTYEQGRGLRKGLRVAIVGKPNVGKSSLLNAIVGSERAIVSAQPGTTRDFIEESVQIGEMRFRFIDTAGVRESVEEIEQEGISRTKRRIQDADILLFLVDASCPDDELDAAISNECVQAREADKKKKLILVNNKIDLGQRSNGRLSIDVDDEVSISALKRNGIDILLRKISKIGKEHFSVQQNEVFISNLRQKLALEKAHGYIQLALQSSDNRLSGEFIARDLRAAADELGILVGEITSEQILDELFANFCIGK